MLRTSVVLAKLLRGVRPAGPAFSLPASQRSIACSLQQITGSVANPSHVRTLFVSAIRTQSISPAVKHVRSYKTDSAAETEEREEQEDRRTRAERLREEMRKSWTLTDPLHLKVEGFLAYLQSDLWYGMCLQFIISQALLRTNAEPEVVSFMSKWYASLFPYWYDVTFLLFPGRTLSLAAYAATILVTAGTLGIDTTPVLALGSVAGVTLGFR
jgi:hypothetical protein